MNLPPFATKADRAREVLLESIEAAGVPRHIGVAIWCAADSYARVMARELNERQCAAMAAAIERDMIARGESV